MFGPAECLSGPDFGFVGRTHGALAGFSRFLSFDGGCGLDRLGWCRGFNRGGSYCSIYASKHGGKFGFKGRDFFFEISGLT